jgi:MoaA/NifB/PqqE/SkfB family radical SAM enzyme
MANKEDFICIKICNQCNNLCRFCIQGKRRYNLFSENIIKHTPLNKSEKEIKEILKKEKMSYNNLSFTGGEPTIDKNLIDYIKYAKKLNYKKIYIQTNGRILAYEKYCLELINAGANFFNILLLGSNSEIHDYLTQSPDSFNQTIKGIKNLIKLNQEFLINVVITKKNYKDIPDMIKKAINLKIKNITFIFMKINNESDRNESKMINIIPRYYQVKKYLKDALVIGTKNGIEIKIQDVPYCILNNYEKYLINDNYEEKLTSFDTSTTFKKKNKSLNCKKCVYFELCEGPYKDYTEIFGWKEFKPIIN